MPHMTDPLFQKCLIYMCDHDNEGAMGVIINKPMPTNYAAEVLSQTGLDTIKPLIEVYLGGPVRVETGLVLHTQDYEVTGTLKVNNSLSVSSNEEIVEDIRALKGPEQFRFILGYAGWEVGQLEREIENGDWLLMPANKEFIFNTPDRSKWEKAASEFGVDINSFSGGPSGKA